MPTNVEELQKLYEKIAAWKPENGLLVKADIKKRVLDVTTKNSEEKLTYSELKMLISNFTTSMVISNESVKLSDLMSVTLNDLKQIRERIDTQKKTSDSLIPIKGISKVMQAKLRDENIYDIPSLIAKGKTPEKRSKLARKLGTDVKLVTSWVKQADLWRVEDMTTDMAYLLVMAGVRQVDDLARVDREKILPIIKGFCMTQVDFEFEESLLDTVIANAGDMVRYKSSPSFGAYTDELVKQIQAQMAILTASGANTDDIKKVVNHLIEDFVKSKNDSSVGYYYNSNIEVDEAEPSHILKALDPAEQLVWERLNGGIIQNGLRSLDNVPFVLPLPRIMSGNVVYKKLSTKENFEKYKDFGYTPLVGAKVEIDGVVSPLTDQTELDLKPSCVTDSNGRFIIVMPEIYSLKDTITITISQGEYKQEFIKSASEVIDSVPEQKIVYQFYELEYLSEEVGRLNKEIENCKDKEDKAERKLGLEKTLEVVEAQYEELKNKVLSLPQCGSCLGTIEDAMDFFQKHIGELNAVLEGTNFDDDRVEGFVVIKEIFENSGLESEKALPKVKLMGNDENPIHLSTDTAPSRIYSYSMLQRLVEPKLTGANLTTGTAAEDEEPSDNRILECSDVTRTKLSSPIDVTGFKKTISENPDKYPQASSLGMGYVLNMHQAWVPDGFSLGNLLYSLILAPGEEQRLVVRENQQTYTISDEASALDATSENYALAQEDDSTAAYNYALNQLMKANSHYDTSASSWSVGGAGALGGFGSGFGGLLGLAGGYSKSKSEGNANSSQSNSHSEASNTAQTFQHSIKSASDKISQAKRVSMEMATSEQTDSVATKIIANHNHSHAMTVQYWEVMRRYKLETCVDSVDLVLFVPLKLIKFLPNSTISESLETATFDMDKFNARYENLIRYADVLRPALPYKYRGGLDLVRKFASMPNWKLQNYGSAQKSIKVTFNSNLLSFDDINVTMVLKNGLGRVVPEISYSRIELTDSDKKNFRSRRELDVFIKEQRNKISGTEQEVTCNFLLPMDVAIDDISYIKIVHSMDSLTYDLCQDTDGMTDYEKNSVDNWQHWLNNFAKDNTDNSGDLKKIDHYATFLPEAFSKPRVDYSTNYLRKFGSPSIWGVKITEVNAQVPSGSDSQSANSEEDTPSVSSPVMSVSISDGTLNPSATICVQSSEKVLHYNEFQKMEDTLQHIVCNPMDYSKVVWAALSDDERVMMLDRYTIDMNFSGEEINEVIVGSSSKKPVQVPDTESVDSKMGEITIPLLNCVNVKKVLGFYGNCMILPFTIPQSLADRIGKTSADIQNSLYRYHTNNFRVPTTTISLPTNGMIGEAVLGETNVSEEIDITRFWNWQDSPIDKMEITKDYLNGTNYLDGVSTKDVTALNMQGAAAATPVTVPDLVKALVDKQTPTFENITALSELKDAVVNNGNNAQKGLDKALDTSKGMAEGIVNYYKAEFDSEARIKEAEAKIEEAKNKPQTQTSGNKTPSNAGDGAKTPSSNDGDDTKTPSNS